jgi:GntR family transcriptional regulator / MocR family aminotransferase
MQAREFSLDSAVFAIEMKRVSNGPVLPVTLNRDSGTPLYRQIYGWFRQSIVDGHLQPGQRVPSTRELAVDLGISRLPVLHAFDQLRAEGYIDSAIGSGTYVSAKILAEFFPDPSGGITGSSRGTSPRKVSRVSARLSSAAKEPWLELFGAFRMNLPAMDHFPLQTWSRCLSRSARSHGTPIQGSGNALGYGPLREVIAQYLRVSRGMRCEPGQVFIVSGSQMALSLSARVLLNPGDPIWMEDPGYPGAVRAFALSGCELIPVPVDAEGLDPTEGLRRSSKARVAYVTPSHQYPTGSTMSLERRMRLLEWASRKGGWIIEDDYDSELHHGRHPIASLQGLDPNARVIYLGTFSKAMFPALRVGYMVVPSDLVAAFAAARDALDIFPPTFIQSVLTDFIQGGHFHRHLRRMRALYAQRCSTLSAALRRELPDVLEVVNEGAGMHTLVLLPAGVRDSTVSLRAASYGVSAMPLSSCSLRKPVRYGLVLGYGGTDELETERGVRMLKLCLQRPHETSSGHKR